MPILTLAFLFILLLLPGCAPKARFAAGQAVIRGEAPAALRPPDSLRTELEMTGFQGGRKSSVSAALSAVPRGKYKLDIYGLPGMVEASFLWTDTGWTLVLYGRDGYLQGYGDTVDLGGLGAGPVPVHDLFGCLWGDFFPGDGGRDSAAYLPEERSFFPLGWEKAGEGAIRYQAGGFPWTARLDPRSGVVREVVRGDSAFRVVYRDYRLRNGRPVPGKVKIFRGDRPLLEIGVESVEDNPAWKRNPFQIRLPKGFSPLPPPAGS